ncbi:hypothetical protein B9S53_16495 [Arthrospira sp. O9.13F]|nr:hypothetical protein B9S53_16495 [Arthrospira sp. O9.13F]
MIYSGILLELSVIGAVSETPSTTFRGTGGVSATSSPPQENIIAFLISIRYGPHPKPLSQKERGALKRTS